MSAAPPEDFSDREAVEAWLRTQPREVSVALAARAALRVIPALSGLDFRDELTESANATERCFRGAASAWASTQVAFKKNMSDGVIASNQAVANYNFSYHAEPEAVAAMQAVAAATATRVSGEFAFLAFDASANGAYGYNYDPRDRDVAEIASARAFGATRNDALVLSDGDPAAIRAVCVRPLWFDGAPDWARESWARLEAALPAGEDWEVWTEWYEARLRGDPYDLALESARVLEPTEEDWADPKRANAKIREIVERHIASEPQGERLDVHPSSGLIDVFPAEVSNPPASDNALGIVADALNDFRNSAVANRAYELNPVVRKLDRALGEHRDNPRRLHDDFVSAARSIARLVERDATLDEIPVTDLRDACANGAIDLRIAVPEVGEMEAARRRKRARLPSTASQSAAKRLLAEIGEGLDPALRDEIGEDIATVEQSGGSEGTELPDSDARDAQLRTAARLAWLRRFAFHNPDKIAAIAARTGRAVDEIEALVTLFRGAEGWWGVLEWLLRSL